MTTQPEGALKYGRSVAAYLLMLAVYLLVAVVLQFGSVLLVGGAILISTVCAVLLADIALIKILIFYVLLTVCFPIAILFAIGAKTDTPSHLATKIFYEFNWISVAVALAAAIFGYLLAVGWRKRSA